VNIIRTRGPGFVLLFPVLSYLKILKLAHFFNFFIDIYTGTAVLCKAIPDLTEVN
jgi:hypothetical protein